jgi:hypothetical protein
MRAKRTAPKKQPKSVRVALELDKLLRYVEESRTLTLEVAQLLCELEACVKQVHDLRLATVLAFRDGSRVGD